MYKSNDADLKDVNAIRKKIVYPREDVLEIVRMWLTNNGVVHFCAPFEAEWQLMHLEQAQLLDGILSADGDTFIVGGNMQVLDVKWNTGECIVYNRAKILSQPSIGGGRWNTELAALSCFLGNVYIKRIQRNGSSQTRKIMTEWVTLHDTARADYITAMAKLEKYRL